MPFLITCHPLRHTPLSSRPLHPVDPHLLDETPHSIGPQLLQVAANAAQCAGDVTQGRRHKAAEPSSQGKSIILKHLCSSATTAQQAVCSSIVLL